MNVLVIVGSISWKHWIWSDRKTKLFIVSDAKDTGFDGMSNGSSI